MYKDKKIIAIIPARGGSKGLKGKNIKKLCGKPLIAYTIETAKKSKYLDEVMVTTDSKEIVSIAKEYKANIPFIRPDNLANDTASSVGLVLHTLDYYQNTLSNKFDYFILLEPTSPLREDDDIDTMIEKLIDNETLYDSITSIGEVSDHPSLVKEIINNSLQPLCKELEFNFRRQDNQKAYFPYGVGYMIKVDTFKNEKVFYTKRNTFHIIQRYQCYEIDDIYDFLAIENIIKYKKGQKDEF